MDTRFRWHMLVTSFLPLWISILVIDGCSIVQSIFRSWPIEVGAIAFLRIFVANNWLQLASMAAVLTVLLTSMICISRFLSYHSGAKNPPRATIKQAKRIRTKTSEFLLAYILPMVAFDFTTLLGVLLFLVYFFILAFLCIRNHNVYINIYLELRHYRLYECDLEYIAVDKPVCYANSLVISKDDLTCRINQDIRFLDFEKQIYIHLVPPKGEKSP